MHFDLLKHFFLLRFEPERVPTFFLWDNTRIDDLALIVTQCVKDSQQLSDLQTSRGSRYSVSDTCSQVKDIAGCAVLSGVSVRNEAMIDKDLASSLSQQYYMSIKKENELYQLHTALMQDAEVSEHTIILLQAMRSSELLLSMNTGS